jgi:DNA repair protein RadD
LTACPECGFEFPRAVKFSPRAGTEALIRGEQELPQVELFRVDRVVYNEHRKEGRPPSIRVSYYCGLRKFDEWVCLEHEGFARKKARDWWCNRAPGTQPPETIAEAFQRLGELRTPTHIRVWVNKKYPEIMDYQYTENDNLAGEQL